MVVTVDWTQLDKVQTSAAAAATDSRMCARIRPNRMKVSTSLPMEEELAAIKRKKKVMTMASSTLVTTSVVIDCYLLAVKCISMNLHHN